MSCGIGAERDDLGGLAIGLVLPLALLVLVLFPFVLLLSLPFRLIGISLDAVFALIGAILFLPARIFGWRRAA